MRVVKNAVLRREQSLGAGNDRVNTGTVREGDEAQFVIWHLAGILDLSSGMIEYTNAGHEPMLLMRGNGDVEPSPLAGGPPFCTGQWRRDMKPAPFSCAPVMACWLFRTV